MSDYKALAQVMYGSIAAGDVDAGIDKYMAEDFVEHEEIPGMDSNPLDIKAIDIVQFRDDKLIGHWGVMNMAGAMAQMGAVPQR